MNLQPSYNYTTDYLPILQKYVFYKSFIISYLQKIKYSIPFYISECFFGHADLQMAARHVQDVCLSD